MNNNYEGKLRFLDYQALASGEIDLLFADATMLDDIDFSLYKLEEPKRINILGLGDVGSTLALALKTIASKSIAEIGVYDINSAQTERMAIELAQIAALGQEKIKVKACEKANLFDCDIFIFTAAAFVPAIGEEGMDVRLVQLEKNSDIIKQYIHLAKEAEFKGEFFILSDPVDLLAKVALDEAKKIGYHALDASKIRAFGLGVMYARALYYAEKNGVADFAERGRVYGAHGKDLIVLNDVFGGYDEQTSLKLTEDVISANLKVRELGFKPYIAPAISSGALTICALLEGGWQHSAVSFGNVFLGMKYKRVENGIIIEAIANNELIKARLKTSIENLEQLYENFSLERG